MQDNSESVECDLFESYRKIVVEVVERVTVVKFVVDNRGSDGTGCFSIKVRTDATEFTDMRLSGLSDEA